MPYWLETDAFADDPIWQVLGAGKADVEDRLQAAYCRLKAKTSHLRDNGYLTAATALTQCRGRRQVLDLLCTSVLERAPLLHRQGDECPCLGETWIDGFAYRIHEFLKRNPSRAENDRAKKQRADLRNARLKAMVYDRDGGCCRYCTSGPLSPKAGKSKDRRKALVFDHVDPDLEAFEDGRNFATSCAACNEFKGHRKPFEADMVLLPPPAPAQRDAQRRRPLQLHDRPAYDPAELVHNTDANLGPITAESATDRQPITDPNAERITDPGTGPKTDHDGTAMSKTGHQQAQQHADQDHGEPGKPLGSGRVGPRPDGGPPGRQAQPARTGAHPDIYHGRSRLPAPDYVWPTGATPHRPGPQPQPAPEEE